MEKTAQGTPQTSSYSSLKDKNLRLEELEAHIHQLKEIADEMDPYSPLPLSMQEKLLEAQISPSDDPFALTNQLLKKMEDAIEQRAKLLLKLGLDPNTSLDQSKRETLQH